VPDSDFGDVMAMTKWSIVFWYRGYACDLAAAALLFHDEA